MYPGYWSNTPLECSKATCLGCGKPTPWVNRYTPRLIAPDGREFGICSGRTSYLPKKPCLLGALAKIHRAAICPGCGKPGRAQGGVRLCAACDETLRAARSIAAENERLRAQTVGEARVGLVTEFLADIAQHVQLDAYDSAKIAAEHVGKLSAELCQTSPRGRTIFRALQHLFALLRRASYERGVRDGASLLRQLNSGALALNDFDRAHNALLEVEQRDIGWRIEREWLYPEHYEDKE